MDRIRQWLFRKALPVHPSAMVLGWGSILLSNSVFQFLEWPSVSGHSEPLMGGIECGVCKAAR